MSKLSDYFPEFCLTFSPNWYLPQIVSIDQSAHLMAFGVNNSIFLMDYLLKTPTTILLSEQNTANNLENPKLSEQQIKKMRPIDEKITSILIYKQYLIAGFENSFLSIWKKDTNLKENSQIILKKYDFCKQFIFMTPYSHEINEDKIICVDSQGITLIITFNEKGIINEELRRTACECEPQTDNNKLKLIAFKMIFENYFLFVFNTGKLEIWPYNFEFLLYEIDLKKKILYFDSIGSKENSIETLKILCITKENLKHTIFSTFFSKDDIEFLYKTKKNIDKKEMVEDQQEKFSLGKIHSEIKLDFRLTENYIHNKEDLRMASVCAKWLNPLEFLISGKMGEIYLLKTTIFENTTKIKFSPLSSESDVKDNSYYTVPDNPHFKSVYEMYLIEPPKQTDPNLILTIGLDRKIVFWNYLKTDIKNTIKFDWKINCLGGKVKCLASSPKERNLIIFGSSDHSIKLWNLEKKNNKFFTIDIWRKLSSFDINSIKVSLEDPEIMYIQANEKQLLVYNAYSQQLLSSFKSSLSIINFYEMINMEFYEFFMTNFNKIDKTPDSFKIEIKNHVHNKAINEDESKFLFIFCKQFNENEIIKNQNQFYFIFYMLKKDKLEVFHINLKNITSFCLKLFNFDKTNLLTMAFGSYQGSINLFYCLKDSDAGTFQTASKEIENIHTYKINCLEFSTILRDKSIFLASGSNDRKIVITSLRFDQNEKILIGTIYKFVHKVQIQSLSWAVNCWKLVCVGVNHHSVQVWDFSKLNEEKGGEEEKNTQEYELCNIRGHSGYVVAADFYAENSQYVVTASDDQTIKVWDTSMILNKKPPNKKKNKKTKK